MVPGARAAAAMAAAVYCKRKSDDDTVKMYSDMMNMSLCYCLHRPGVELTAAYGLTWGAAAVEGLVVDGPYAVGPEGNGPIGLMYLLCDLRKFDYEYSHYHTITNYTNLYYTS